MPRRKSEEIRFFGPYRHHDKWRVQRRGGGKPATWIPFDTEEEARRAIRSAQTKLATTGRTVGEAVDAYLKHLEEAGNAPRSLKAEGFSTKPKDTQPLLLGIAYSASIGGVATPIGTRRPIMISISTMQEPATWSVVMRRAPRFP